MLSKVVLYCYVVTSYVAVADLGYDEYYGKTLFQYLNTTWSTGNGLFPLNIIFRGEESENVTDNTQCITDIRKFRSSLSLLEPWSVQMADSSGGLLPGALTGNLINLGGYDECMSVREVGLPGKYCWLKMSLNGSNHQDLSFVPHNVPIIHSLCLPDSCKAHDVQEIVSNEIGSTFSTSVSCQERPQEWGPWEICGTLFFSLLILSSIMSTLYEKFWATDYKGCNELWCSFSLLRNIKSLSTNQPNKFSSIDGLRVLSQFYVITYHVFRDVLKNDVPVFNKFYTSKLVRSWEGIAIVCASFSVDTFTVIGGFLVMYSIMGKKGKKIVMSQHIFNRFMRIYPPYAICLILMLTLAGKMCDGPLCESIVYSRQDLCKKVWWTNVLCIQNIYPGLTKSCMSHTWYVAADWQLYALLSPLIIIGLRENKKITTWAIAGTSVAACLVVFILTVSYDLKTETLLFDRASDAKIYYDALYTQPYSRLGPWCIGLLFGIIMDYQKKDKFTLKKEQIIFFWGLTGLIMVSVVLLDLPFQHEQYEYSSIEAGLYNALSRPLWSLAICWIIYSCSAGYGGPLNEVLSSIPFQLLGKLSYSAYLIHKLVVNLYFANLRGPIFISPIQQVTLVFGLIALSFIAAFFFYLLAEIPFLHVAKFLLNGRKREVDPPTVPEPSQPDANVTGFEALELGSARNPQDG